MTDNPDVISPSSPSDDASSSSTGVSALDPEDQPPQQPSPPAAQDEDAAAKKGDSAGVLRRYIESFDQQTMIDTARLVRDTQIRPLLPINLLPASLSH